MKGAAAVLPKIRRPPTRPNTIKMGRSHHFLFCIRKSTISSARLEFPPAACVSKLLAGVFSGLALSFIESLSVFPKLLFRVLRRLSSTALSRLHEIGDVQRVIGVEVLVLFGRVWCSARQWTTAARPAVPRADPRAILGLWLARISPMESRIGNAPR